MDAATIPDGRSNVVAGTGREITTPGVPLVCVSPGSLSAGVADEILVERAIGGDTEAFDELVRRHREGAVQTARLILEPDRAEDAVQDALILAFRFLPKIRDRARFGRWLSAITRFRALRILRAENRRHRGVVPLDDTIPEIAAQLATESREDRPGDEEVIAALAGIPADYAEVVRLHFLHGVPHLRISELLHVSLSTVKWRCYRGKNMLRALLEPRAVSPQRLQTGCQACSGVESCPEGAAPSYGGGGVGVPVLCAAKGHLVRAIVKVAVHKIVPGLVILLRLLVPSHHVRAQTSTTMMRVLRNGFGPVTFLRFSPDGGELARICESSPLELFEALRYKSARTLPDTVIGLAYSPDGARIATAEAAGGARLWDARARGEPMPYLPPLVQADRYMVTTPLGILQGPTTDGRGGVQAVEFSPDGKRLLTAHADGRVKLWNTGTWTIEAEIVPAGDDAVAAAFHPDGRTILLAGQSGTLHEWTVDGKTEIGSTPTIGSVTGIAYSPDGNSLVTTHRSQKESAAVVWTGDRQSPDVRKGFGSAAFSRDGRVLALGGNRVELLEPVSRKGLRTVMLPELTPRETNPQQYGALPSVRIPVSVVALAFSPDGRTLAAGMAEGTVRFIDLSR